MRYFITSIFLMSAIICLAQPINTANIDKFFNGNKVVVNALKYEDIKGSPFSNDDFIQGTVYFVSGDRIENLPLRYNWYSHSMQYQYEGKVMELGNTIGLSNITIGNTKYVPFNSVKSINGFLVELLQGKNNLYLREDIAFIDAKPAQTGYDDNQPASFQRGKPQYILISEEGEILKLNLNKKRFAEQFPDMTAEINKEIKKKKLNPKNEEDLVSIISFINSLSEKD